jgi:hypothetical protein
MGQTQSIILPSGKHFTMSYCCQKKIGPGIICRKNVNLINLIDKYDLSTTTELISSVFKYKINFLGYSFKPVIPLFNKIELNTYFSKIKIYDLVVKSECYTIDNFHHFINCGDILISGIILDPPFLKGVLSIDAIETVTDIVLIVGYTPETIIIKSTWKKELIEIPNDYLNNFKEIWNIKILNSEEKYPDII